MSDCVMVPREPTAWIYDLATLRNLGTKEYSGWERRLSFDRPNAPKEAIRDLKPLFAAAPAAPQPTEMVERAYDMLLHNGISFETIRFVFAMAAPHFHNEQREADALIAERHAVEWPSRYHGEAGQDMAVACTKVAAAIRASKEPT